MHLGKQIIFPHKASLYYLSKCRRQPCTQLQRHEELPHLSRHVSLSPFFSLQRKQSTKQPFPHFHNSNLKTHNQPIPQRHVSPHSFPYIYQTPRPLQHANKLFRSSTHKKKISNLFHFFRLLLLKVSIFFFWVCLFVLS